MDDVKLVKLVDAIVKQRLQAETKKLVKRIVQEELKAIKKTIKEEVKSQLIGILLENKIDLKTGKRKTSQISELLSDQKAVKRYPKIKQRERIEGDQERQERQVVEERYLTRDPVLNHILNSTPYIPDSGGGGFTGNALMDSMGMDSENMQYAQNMAGSLGKNVKVDINPDAVNGVRNNIPNNAQFITDKKTPHLKEYMGDDGFKYVDDRMLFENDRSQPATNMMMSNSVNLERALNRNYKQLLGKMDEKAQKFRGKPLNRIN